MSAAPPTAASPLADWLGYLETLHPKAIALGLDRVAAVAARLRIAPSCPVITVTGTNGKGSTCAYMEAMLRAGGYRVGLYTSPHLLRYTERVRIDGIEVDDAAMTEAFAAVERVRDGVALTYFEFGTLAALWLFARAPLDALILEVGLGGRLDAVNVIDADVAVITGIGIDHVDYLGGTRESIGFEKAGVLRAARPGVCADPDPPRSLLAHAAAIGAPLFRLGTDFGYVIEGDRWQYWVRRGQEIVRRHGLPLPALRGAIQVRNAAAALTGLELLAGRLAVPMGAVRDGLVGVDWPARFQVLPGRPAIILDVAHNPQAAAILALNLGDMGYFPRTTAVFSILADKDIAGVAGVMRPRIDRWLIAPSGGARGATAAHIGAGLAEAGIGGEAVVACDDIAQALARAREEAGEADRIVVFGSFVTVAAALLALERTRGPEH
ncbi:MAG: bifunctional tetrahydrofolate synthase/dihydrofolate synthase [Betaproteobacteria bacterium]|nr:bifunctional tetrahydrofolate synthase/dihydrofolate synthase [Betaproteobacteria bacterium]